MDPKASQEQWGYGCAHNPAGNPLIKAPHGLYPPRFTACLLETGFLKYFSIGKVCILLSLFLLVGF
ncbi:hypothetical protein V7128_07105 [Neobacillus vireti]|uniref:hypothetical protein n=1 Tax=Neobacillus vireti TaxID=220686 RepID=UPI002FFE7ADD